MCIDATAAALLHDIGHLFLPDEIRGVPEPLLDDRAKPVFRNHTFAGAQMLLGGVRGAEAPRIYNRLANGTGVGGSSNGNGNGGLGRIGGGSGSGGIF